MTNEHEIIELANYHGFQKFTVNGKALICTPENLIKFANALHAEIVRDCAAIADRQYGLYKATKEAHERFSPTPFNPANFSINMDSVNLSRWIADSILSLLEPNALPNDEVK